MKIGHEPFGFCRYKAKMFTENQNRPTKRAPDEWWAPLFGAGSSESFGSVS
jgi:hypothetical protein